LLEELKVQGYSGGISRLRDYLREFKGLTAEPIQRFETAPGKQMQVDWAVFRRSHPRLSALIATLGFSRMTYVEFVDNERLETLLLCLHHAFEALGGVPHDVLFDNMKTVVIERHGYGTGIHRFQAGLWDFAKHYGFKPKLCQPYRAQTKGKVERFIRYLRESFYVPLRATLAQVNLQVDTQTANEKVKVWLAHTANCRLHATLNIRPIDRWQDEQTTLQPLPVAYAGLLVPQSSQVKVCLPQQVPTLSLQHDLSVYQAIVNQEAVYAA
jgi:transposase